MTPTDKRTKVLFFAPILEYPPAGWAPAQRGERSQGAEPDIRVAHCHVGASGQDGVARGGRILSQAQPCSDTQPNQTAELLEHADVIVVAKKEPFYDEVLNRLGTRSLVDLVYLKNFHATSSRYDGLTW